MIKDDKSDRKDDKSDRKDKSNEGDKDVEDNSE